MSDEDTGAAHLATRDRRTLQGDGETATTQTVFCPVRGTSMTVAECVACERCEGVVLDTHDRPAFVRCQVEMQPADIDLRLARDSDCTSTAGQTPISEAMTRAVICVRADLSLEALMTLFLDQGISGAPVVDDDGRPIGVVSKTDLLRELHDAGGDEEHEPVTLQRGGVEIDFGPGFHAERISRSTVGEIMMPIAFTLRESAPISRAAALMAIEGVHRIPVISDEGGVVGILSAMDVLRWLAREDGYVLPSPRD